MLALASAFPLREEIKQRERPRDQREHPQYEQRGRRRVHHFLRPIKRQNPNTRKAIAADPGSSLASSYGIVRRYLCEK